MPKREHGVVENLTEIGDEEFIGTILTMDASHKPTGERLGFIMKGNPHHLKAEAPVGFVRDSLGETPLALELEPMGLWRNSDEFRRLLRA